MYLSDLPGKEAHLKMAPQPRVITLKAETAPPAEARQSAVLVLLFPPMAKSEAILSWEVLLIKRNKYEGVHSDQIAFPGGKCEPSDMDYIDTACREAFEELGIKREQIDILGQLSHLYVPPSNFTIHPVLALAKSEIEFNPSRREVSGYKKIPLERFDPASCETCRVEMKKNVIVNAPCYIVEDYLIWGATAMILAELYQIAYQLINVAKFRTSLIRP